jgi:hypothetical protein
LKSYGNYARAAFLLGLAASFAYGQVTTSRLEGTVQDSSGAIVPDATVSVVNSQNQERQAQKVNDQGGFVFASLQPGFYNLTAEAPGFRTAVVSKLELTVGGTSNQIVKMEVGATSETVSVEANALSVQTSDSMISRAITLKDIETLPQLARTPITLAVFQPGAQISPGDTSFTRINGQRQGSNNTTLDGIDTNDSVVPRLGLSLTSNNTDSVGEFRIVTEGGKAEYGRNAGGQVELITRSGTNDYHGNAFDYLRNTALNANDFFNNASGVHRPVFIQNQYGGSFGGPIKHNKLFIFGNYQGRQTHQQIVRNRTVLTPQAKSGIFRYVNAGGATQSYSIINADPRKIGIDPAVAKNLALLPDLNNTDLGDGLNTAGYRFNQPNNSLEDQFTIKGDWNPTDKIHAFLRWSWERNSAIDSLNSADAPFPGGAQGSQGGHRWGYSTGMDYTLTSTLFNEVRFGHQSATVQFNRPGRIAGPDLISNDFTDPYLSGFGQGRNSPVNEIIDNVTKTIGSHTLKFGANIRHTDQYGYNYAGVYPNVTFDTGNGNAPPASVGPAGLTGANLTRFQNLYNELLGRVSQVTETFYSDLNTFQAAGTPRVRNFILQEQGYYAQDDWKVNRRLTLNLGLRWEIFNAPTESGGFQGTLSQIGSLTDSANISNLTLAKTHSYYKTNFGNVAPRFGFAYDVFGDGRMAVRGNYGIFFDRNAGAVVSLVDGNTPGFAQAVPVFPNASGGDIRVSDGLPLPAQPSAPVLTPALTRGTSIVVINPNLKTGYVQEYSLNVQRELFRNTVAEVGYVGARGVHLFMDRDINQPRIYGNFLTSFSEVRNYINSKGTTPLSANNVFVKAFGTEAAAVKAIGSTPFTTNNVASVANTLDRNNNAKYGTAGVSQFYLRNYPQFNQVIYGSNDGRNYYDSLQVSLRRTSGSIRTALNYTYSKSIDNISVDGNGFTSAIDNYNLALNRSLGDYDHRHSFNATFSYTLPFGKGKRYGGDMPRWLDTAVGGWDLGVLAVAQDGSVFSLISPYGTNGNPNASSFLNYTGDRSSFGSVQKQGNGVFYFQPADVANLSVPDAGQIGTSGRNAFRGPKYVNFDASLVKHFAITEHQALTFRAEAYNVFNHVNFSGFGTSFLTPATYGKFSSDQGGQGVGSRNLQLALRYDF